MLQVDEFTPEEVVAEGSTVAGRYRALLAQVIPTSDHR